MSSLPLLELAKERFRDDWTDADETLFVQTAKGEVAYYGEGDPSDADNWGDERVLKVNRIEWLCTDREAIKEVTRKGVQIIGARTEGELDLSFAKIGFPLAIMNSAMRDGMILRHCHLPALLLNGTFTGPIHADGIRVEHSLLMRGGFQARGEVRLVGAKIDGSLECDNSQFCNSGGRALSADGIEVKGQVFLRSGFRSTGVVSLLGAKIGGDLSCTNGHFDNSNGDALTADGAMVGGTVFLDRGFYAQGEVRLACATIGRILDCGNGHFSSANGRALSADGVDVGGGVFFHNEFQATGEVRLLGAKIAGNLDCENGRFFNANGRALNADRVDVKGHVILRGQWAVRGVVDFTAAIVGGYFQWLQVESPERCALCLESAEIGTLWDEEKSWPVKLYLDGLVYDRLHRDAPVGSKERLKWLGLQGYGNDKFVPQPYVQLAKVLQEMGHEEDARKILIAKEEDPARVKKLPILRRGGHHVLGWTIGYGYRPWRALLWILGFITIGTIAFGNGAKEGSPEQMMKDGARPAFNAFVYSVDTFVPLVDLHQAKYWLPATPWLCVYHWVHIGLGWVLTTLLVVGLTGLVRK